MVFFEQHGLEGKELFKWFTLENNNFPLHFHRAYELIFVHDGKLKINVQQKEYLIRKNQVAFIFSNQVHGFQSVGDSKISVVIFSPELIGDFFMKYKGYIPENNILQLKQMPDFRKLDTIFRQKSFLYYLCAKLEDEVQFVPVSTSKKMEILYNILLFVDQNYHKNCTLKDVAKHLKYDYAYLSKLFIQMTNMTFTEYVNHFRISQARYLLKNTQLSISEIAINCGYNNLRTFNRNFKKITKLSPNKYREMA